MFTNLSELLELQLLFTKQICLNSSSFVQFASFPFFYDIYRILHVIKRNIRHNAVAQIEYEAVFAFHPVEEAVNAVLNFFFVGI
jgi:hypothetical protein